MSNWNSELTKENYKQLKLKITRVEYEPFNESFYLYFIDEKEQEDIYCLEKNSIKVLKNLTDKELLKVNILGERAIQFEEVDIQIELDGLLNGLQMINSWLDALK